MSKGCCRQVRAAQRAAATGLVLGVEPMFSSIRTTEMVVVGCLTIVHTAGALIWISEVDKFGLGSDHLWASYMPDLSVRRRIVLCCQ
jgi:hypothetical protein